MSDKPTIISEQLPIIKVCTATGLQVLDVLIRWHDGTVPLDSRISHGRWKKQKTLQGEEVSVIDCQGSTWTAI